MEERKRKTMKINAIGVTTFGNKQQFVKKAAAGLMTAAGAGLAADTFVKVFQSLIKLLKMKLSKVTTKAGILVILSAAVMIAIARDDITDFRN